MRLGHQTRDTANNTPLNKREKSSKQLGKTTKAKVRVNGKSNRISNRKDSNPNQLAGYAENYENQRHTPSHEQYARLRDEEQLMETEEDSHPMNRSVSNSRRNKKSQGSRRNMVPESAKKSSRISTNPDTLVRHTHTGFYQAKRQSKESIAKQSRISNERSLDLEDRKTVDRMHPPDLPLSNNQKHKLPVIRILDKDKASMKNIVRAGDIDRRERSKLNQDEYPSAGEEITQRHFEEPEEGLYKSRSKVW